MKHGGKKEMLQEPIASCNKIQEIQREMSKIRRERLEGKVVANNSLRSNLRSVPKTKKLLKVAGVEV